MRIVLLSIAFACIYGVLHDQITARICLAYFTVWHPPLYPTTEPTLVALTWGIAATWWVGLLLGVPLAWAANSGRRRQITVRELLPKFGLLGLTMAAGATFAGIGGYLWAPSSLAQQVGYHGADTHAFLADLFAHNASYDIGIVGGIVLVAWTYRQSLRQPANL